MNATCAIKGLLFAFVLMAAVLAISTAPVGAVNGVEIDLIPAPPGTPSDAENGQPATLAMGPGEVQDVRISLRVAGQTDTNEVCVVDPFDTDDDEQPFCTVHPDVIDDVLELRFVGQPPVGVTAEIAGGDLHLEVDSTAQAGVHSLIVEVSIEGASAEAELELTVLPFSLVPSVTTVALKPGESTTIAVAISRTADFLEELTFQVSLVHLEGSSIVLNYTPNPATSADTTTTLDLSVGPAVNLGTYTVNVRGTGGEETRRVPITVRVKRCRTFGGLEFCK